MSQIAIVSRYVTAGISSLHSELCDSFMTTCRCCVSRFCRRATHSSATSEPLLQNFASSSIPSSWITVESTSKQTASARLQICFTSNAIVREVTDAPLARAASTARSWTANRKVGVQLQENSETVIVTSGNERYFGGHFVHEWSEIGHYLM